MLTLVVLLSEQCNGCKEFQSPDSISGKSTLHMIREYSISKGIKFVCIKMANLPFIDQSPEKEDENIRNYEDYKYIFQTEKKKRGNIEGMIDAVPFLFIISDEGHEAATLAYKTGKSVYDSLSVAGRKMFYRKHKDTFDRETKLNTSLTYGNILYWIDSSDTILLDLQTVPRHNKQESRNGTIHACPAKGFMNVVGKRV